jgi:hypothetical protein
LRIRRRCGRQVTLALLLVVAGRVAAAAGSFEVLFAPKADLWHRWTAHDETSIARVEHSEWDRLLQTYRVPGADGVARFAYGRVSQSDRAALAAYLDDLAAAAISRYPRGRSGATRASTTPSIAPRSAARTSLP